MLVCFILSAVITANLQAQDAPPRTLAAAITDGNAGVELRYRFEYVDQDNFASAAKASTLRARLNYETVPFRGFQGFAEFDYVAVLLLDEHNSGGGTSPRRIEYPVVADPDGADLNQLFLDFKSTPDTRLRVGRQRILLDNQRFVGGVGWRQNEQTYDAATLQLTAPGKVAIRYSYLVRINRIFGDRSPAGRNDSDTHLLNAQFSLPDAWTMSAYAYRIDDEDVPAYSTLTLGARLGKAIPVGERKIAFAGEFARQSDAASAPINFRAEYYRFDAKVSLNDRVSAGIGFESLGGDRRAAGKALQTPLATLHAFQGWADQFLTTPDAGIDDWFAAVDVNFAPWKLSATWHQFSAEDGGKDWGSEFDLSATYKFDDRYALLLKTALFNADSPAFSDASKFWLMFTAAY